MLARYQGKSSRTPLSNGSLFHNIGYLGILQAANYLPPLLVIPYLSRILGAESFGVMNYAIGIATYCVLVTDWGFNLSASREIARNRDDSQEISRIFWNTLSSKIVLACLTLVLLSIAIVALPSLRLIASPLYAAWLLVIGNVLTLNWLFQGLEQLGKYAFFSVIGKLLLLPLIFFAVSDSGDTTLAISIQAFGSIVSGLLSMQLIFKQKIIERPFVSLQLLKSHLSRGWNVFLSTAAINFYTTSNVVFLGALTDLKLVGLFVGADKIRYAVSGLATPFSTALYPRVSRLMLHDKFEGIKLAGIVLAIEVVVLSPICLFLFYYSEQTVLLILGREFVDSAELLRILAWIPLVTAASNTFGIQILLSLGASALFRRIVFCSAVFNFAMLVPLVHIFAAKGVAWTILFTECFTTLAMGAFAYKAAYIDPKR